MAAARSELWVSTAAFTIFCSIFADWYIFFFSFFVVVAEDRLTYWDGVIFFLFYFFLVRVILVFFLVFKLPDLNLSEQMQKELFL